MKYRKLPKGDELISIIGIGGSSINTPSEKEIEETVLMAVDNGVNFFDIALSDAKPFKPYGRAFEGCRDKVYLQVHFGANYETGKYGWTTDLETVKRSVDLQLKDLKTDYIDFGFIHCLDKTSDLEKVMSNGVLDYISQLKAQGVVRHIGLSSHAPDIVHRMIDTGLLEMVMFSINAAYDYKHGSYAIGSVDERQELYRRCEKEGVGISVMKPFGGGQLLDAKASPFGKSLTKYQCMKYALDKPGVLTVLPGIRGKEDLQEVLGYLKATEEELDYSVLGTFTPADAEGKCVYCSHCHPCPMGLDIALINKYYDLSMLGDELAADHYRKLEHGAGECVQCGHCNSRCPFHVDQMARMKVIEEYFGR